MPSLISPELMAQLYLQRSMPNTLRGPQHPQPVGHVQFHAPAQVDPLYFNMADQQQDQPSLIAAQRMRLRGSATLPNAAREQGPLADHIQGSKVPPPTAADFGPVQQQAPMAGLAAGQMSIGRPGQMQTFQGTPGTVQGTHPAVALLAALQQQGIPPQQLEVYKQSLINGATTQQVLSHAHQFIRDQQAEAHRQESEQRTARREQTGNLKTDISDHERHIAELEKRKLAGEDDKGIDKDLTAAQQELGALRTRLNQSLQTEQPPQQPQIAQQPQGGRGGGKPQAQKMPSHDVLMQFYQQAGGDPQKAYQLAKAAGY